ncbi:uncharacterized protein LOC108039844 isoform X1 [Drosophila rhopaloa]|uniref:Uncharacterized protein LOC108039844 isoform X1 n=1 Tax=Drosophila rhopaloa TaxID=1041015 RepID=A0A6P4E7C3_DRORH|nr:uncharacterized protein LOC108039844 isoform X1 [Drosophila rhopaloa]
MALPLPFQQGFLWATNGAKILLSSDFNLTDLKMPYYTFVVVGWILKICFVGILIRACCLCARKKVPSQNTSSGRIPDRGPVPGESPANREPGIDRIDPSGVNLNTDRQGNVFNVPEEPSGNRYGDIFFIEPGSVEANRIRDQLEKDEKDLPSYDEVMRMCNLTTPTAAAAGTPQSPLGEPGPIGIAALPAPPYSETDPQAAAGGATVIAMEPMEPSTSRAAQIPPSSGSGPPAPPPTAV